MTQVSPSRDQDKFMVRMPNGMRDRIAEEAEKNGRSMNAEIVARLEQSFEQPKKPPPEVSKSPGWVAITAIWSYVISEETAKELAKLGLERGNATFGFLPAHADQVVLSLTSDHVAKAAMSIGEAATLLEKIREPRDTSMDYLLYPHRVKR